MKDRIRRVMAKVFEVSEDVITESVNQDSLENWDSIHHVKMIVLLEREFDITIPDAKVGNMISFKLITEVINGCLQS